MKLHCSLRFHTLKMKMLNCYKLLLDCWTQVAKLVAYIANLPAKIFCYYGDHNGCSLECCHYFFKTNLSMEI